MARINNLTNFLTDIATAIKSKTGKTAKIKPSNFDTEILSIKSNLGNKSVSITSNGTNTYQATNDNLDGYSQVTVTTNVQPSLQSKTITANGTYNASSDNVDGYSSVTVNVPSSLPTITDSRYLFSYSRSNLYSQLVDMFENVTSFAYMFYYADNVANINFSKLQKFNINAMNHMFYFSKFISLDLSNLNTSNVTTMNYMFSSATSLTSLNMSNLDTSKVTNMTSMFNGANKLATLDISNFDFSNVTSYSKIFASCGTDNATPTTVYVKDATAQQWILNLSSSDRPSNWSTDNVIIKGS